MSVQNIPLPALPVPSSPDDGLPLESERIIISTVEDVPILMNWRDLFIEPKVGGKVYSVDQSVSLNVHVGNIYGAPPPKANFEFRRFWKRLDDQVVYFDAPYMSHVTYTHGIATEHSESLKMSLGLGIEGFSASVEKEVTNSTTITDEVSLSIDRPVNGTEGMQTFYSLWQLVEEYALVGVDGKPLVMNPQAQWAVLTGYPDIIGDQQEWYFAAQNVWQVPEQEIRPSIAHFPA